MDDVDAISFHHQRPGRVPKCASAVMDEPGQVSSTMAGPLRWTKRGLQVLRCDKRNKKAEVVEVGFLDLTGVDECN